MRVRVRAGMDFTHESTLARGVRLGSAQSRRESSLCTVTVPVCSDPSLFPEFVRFLAHGAGIVGMSFRQVKYAG